MSWLCSRVVRLLSVGVCVFLAGLSQASAQSSTSPAASEPPAAVRAAVRFVFAAYPELTERPVTFQVQPAGEHYVVRIVEQTPPTTEAASSPLVSAVLAFDAAGHLRHYRATGRLLDEARNETLRQQVAANPGWTDEDIDIALQRLGGTSTVGRSVPVSTGLSDTPVARFLGHSAQATRSSVQWRTENTPIGQAVTIIPAPPHRTPVDARTPASLPPPPLLAVSPRWVIDAVAEQGDGTTVRYRLEYEPFGGRLVGVVRQ